MNDIQKNPYDYCLCLRVLLAALLAFQVFSLGCRNVDLDEAAVPLTVSGDDSDRFVWLYQIASKETQLSVDSMATTAGAPPVEGHHIKYESDQVDLKVDLTVLPDGSFPPAFSALIGRELQVERYADLVVAYLDDAQKAKVRPAVIEGLSRNGAEIKDLPFAKVWLENKANEVMSLRVSVEITGYSREAAMTVNIEPGQAQRLEMSPSFKKSIMEIAEEAMISAAFRVERINGGMLFEETVPIRLLSKNDMVWSRIEYLDMAGLVATFVTPRDSARSIDTLLREAADLAPIGQLVGYQSLETYVQGDAAKRYTDFSHVEITEMQLQAIYEAIQARGMAYVNTPTSFKSGAQRVKFADEVLGDRSGNCIELSLLFASALEALGMRPEIILLPGHCMVGVRAWSRLPGQLENEPLIVLESTFVGRASYEEARQRGAATYALADKDSLVLLLPIDLLRQLGIPAASR